MKPLWWMKLHYRFHGAGGEHIEWVYVGTYEPTKDNMAEVAEAMSLLIAGPGGWSCSEEAVPMEQVPEEVVRGEITATKATIEAMEQKLLRLEGK